MILEHASVKLRIVADQIQLASPTIEIIEIYRSDKNFSTFFPHVSRAANIDFSFSCHEDFNFFVTFHWRNIRNLSNFHFVTCRQFSVSTTFLKISVASSRSLP